MVCRPGITNHAGALLSDTCMLTRRTLYMQCRYALEHHYLAGSGQAGV